MSAPSTLLSLLARVFIQSQWLCPLIETRHDRKIKLESTVPLSDATGFRIDATRLRVHCRALSGVSRPIGQHQEPPNFLDTVEGWNDNTSLLIG